MRFLLAIALLSLAAASPLQAQQRVLKLAAEGANPPFNQRDGDSFTGFDIDIGNAICARLHYECAWVGGDWDRLAADLNAKQFDVVISSMPISDETLKTVDFSKPYYRVPYAFIARSDDPLNEATIAALKGKTVGVEAGTQAAAYLTEVFDQEGITLRSYGSLEEAELDLAEERIDAVFGGKMDLAAWLKSTADGACCHLFGAGIYDDDNFGPGPGMAFRKEDTELREAFDQALGDLLADGTYDTIAAKYVGFSIRPDEPVQKLK